MQPSSMGMPLDMVLACSNHASWNCGPLAFGLPSASNKLSQPDSSDVPSTLKNTHTKKKRKTKPERQRVWGREKQKWDQVRKIQTSPKRNWNEENKRTSQTHYLFQVAGKATLIVLRVHQCCVPVLEGFNPQLFHLVITSSLFVMGRDNVSLPCLTPSNIIPHCTLLTRSDKIKFVRRLNKACSLWFS